MSDTQQYYKVEAYIKPIKIEDVREALLTAGIRGMTVFEVRGTGLQKGRSELYRGRDYTVDFLPKLKVEVVVAGKELSDRVSLILNKAARTGHVGDGLVTVSDLNSAIQIVDGQPFQQ